MLKKIFKTYIANTRGATAVEFALVALPFILMMFGIMESARVVWMRNGVEYAAKETIRYAAINNELTDGEFQIYAQGKLDGMKLPDGNISLVSTTYTTSGINFIEMTVNYNITTMFSGLLPFIDFNYNKTLRKPLIE